MLSVFSKAAAMVVMLSFFAVSAESVSRTEIIVFAAASMTETMTAIQSVYERSHPDVKIMYNFDSSGTLRTQIQEGAECDLFISAGQKQMNDLAEHLLAGSRINLLENRIVLVVPEDNPKGLKSFDDLASALTSREILLAMGNSDVPVGQYTRKILEFYGLDEVALASAGKITYGTNVKEVTLQVKEGSVDCGVVYSTDAYSGGLQVKDTARLEMCGQVLYPAAVMKESKKIDAAREFLRYLTDEEAMKIFSDVGFVPAL